MKVYLGLPLFLTLSLFMNAQKVDISFTKVGANGQLQLTSAGASHFAQLALNCLQQEYPNKLNQVLPNSDMLLPPKRLHPAFYGCFDWHSAVHGHWMLIRLLKEFPDIPEADDIRLKLNTNLTRENILEEVVYLEQASKSWERMYGWAWLLKLAEELYTWKDSQGKQWLENLKPLTATIVDRYLRFLPIQQYPVRTGVHPNTAFGLSFAWDYAETVGDKPLRVLIEQRSKDYYLQDQNCPAAWEPSGEDFLSPCLEEANLMRKVLPPEPFQTWFQTFLPDESLNTFTLPADVSDRSDPKIVHLDGVNLSRAWCFYGILPYLKNAKLRVFITDTARKHLEATLPFIASQHYEGTHWLASFAVFALSSRN